MGKMPIDEIRPVHVSRLIREIWDSGQQSTALCVLQETRLIFVEAINAGMVDTNPAACVRALPYHVKRSRLSLGA
jgi:hypothetical protein